MPDHISSLWKRFLEQCYIVCATIVVGWGVFCVFILLLLAISYA